MPMIHHFDRYDSSGVLCVGVSILWCDPAQCVPKNVSNLFGRVCLLVIIHLNVDIEIIPNIRLSIICDHITGETSHRIELKGKFLPRQILCSSKNLGQVRICRSDFRVMLADVLKIVFHPIFLSFPKPPIQHCPLNRLSISRISSAVNSFHIIFEVRVTRIALRMTFVMRRAMFLLGDPRAGPSLDAVLGLL